MNSLKRTFVLFMVTALMAFGAAFAQDDDQQQDQDQQTQQETQTEQEAEQETTTRTVEIRGEEVAPLGEIQVGESQPYEESESRTVEVEVRTGAIAISATTPGDERPNIDLVGPSGYYEHFEVSTDDQHLVEGLLPGVYSISATDDGLQVAHTLVEVTAGEAISVQISLQELAAYEEGAFQPDASTRFPDDSFRAEEPQATENTEVGEVTVNTDSENARFVVTGPNNYSQEFTGSFTAGELPPGVYVVAGTREDAYQIEGTLSGAQIATSAVAVNVSQAVTMVPVYDIVGAEIEEVDAKTEEVEDVAGGGEAEQQQEGEEEQQEQEQQQEQEKQEDEEEQQGQQEDQQQEGQQAQEGDAEGEEVAGGGEAQQEQTVQVGLTEYSIDMPKQVSAGRVTFEITNDGDVEHSFEIEGQGIEESLDQNLQPGESATLTVDLEAGTYTVYCPVADHEDEGMTMELEVTEQEGG